MEHSTGDARDACELLADRLIATREHSKLVYLPDGEPPGRGEPPISGEPPGSGEPPSNVEPPDSPPKHASSSTPGIAPSSHEPPPSKRPRRAPARSQVVVDGGSLLGRAVERVLDLYNGAGVYRLSNTAAASPEHVAGHVLSVLQQAHAAGRLRDLASCTDAASTAACVEALPPAGRVRPPPRA